jgi:hypothetical protein
MDFKFLFVFFFAASQGPSLSEASCAHGTSLHPRAEDGEIKVNTFGYTGEIVCSPPTLSFLPMSKILISLLKDSLQTNQLCMNRDLPTGCPSIQPPMPSALLAQANHPST